MKNKPDRAIVVERTVTADGMEWPIYDVKHPAGKTLSPSPFRHKSKAQAWAAEWNRKNVPKVAEVKAAQRRVALIKRFVEPIKDSTWIQLRRMYGDDFIAKLGETRQPLLDCREIILEAEKKVEPCQTPETRKQNEQAHGRSERCK